MLTYGPVSGAHKKISTSALNSAAMRHGNVLPHRRASHTATAYSTPTWNQVEFIAARMIATAPRAAVRARTPLHLPQEFPSRFLRPLPHAAQCVCYSRQ